MASRAGMYLGDVLGNQSQTGHACAARYVAQLVRMHLQVRGYTGLQNKFL